MDTGKSEGEKRLKYSICMTCYNEAKTVSDSLRSLLGQLDGDFEVIIVDNFSVDGTYRILQEFERDHRITVVRRRCSRGEGRQIAFENASGEYIVANLDLDDLFLPVIKRVIELYHKRTDGYVLAVFNSQPPPGTIGGWIQNMTIGPRGLISSLGGWRDVNVYEDWDIWSRASEVDRYAWGTFRFASNDTVHMESDRMIGRLVQRYERYRNRLLLGMRVFSPGEKKGTSQRLAYIAARLSLVFRKSFVGQDPRFDSLDPARFVDLTGAVN